MLSPLRPLLCRHDFYWSERHRSDRCRRCGKLQTVEAGVVLTEDMLAEPRSAGGVAEIVRPLALDALPAFTPAASAFTDFEEPRLRAAARSPETIRPSARVLKAQAGDRRAKLMDLLDRLADGERPSREEAIDAVLAVIEDAHSAEPVLFGRDAAGHFARLHEARSAPAA